MFASRMALMGFSHYVVRMSSPNPSATVFFFFHLCCVQASYVVLMLFSKSPSVFREVKTAMRVLIYQTFLDISLRRTSKQKKVRP